ncbi:MAG: DNA-binding response regulator [Chloroflexi bacterium RBG_13_46_14]|nr:MAG: DNA-binding response regulator [Chloroflexi bacterium RBG_13_46_14]
MKKTCILVVDDELSIIKLLRANLEAEGCQVLAAINGVEALNVFEKEPTDLVILDITMPEMDGFEVCRRIREWSQIPIIMLSAINNESDKVKCLELGADDYITKPFGKDELSARVKAVIRRSEAATSIPVQPSFNSGNLEINFSQRRVTINGEEVKLTPTEYNLLQTFVLNKGKVLTHTQLLNRVWGPEYRDEREYLYVFIPRLRSKLKDNPENPWYIATVSGIGYQFIDNS